MVRGTRFLDEIGRGQADDFGGKAAKLGELLAMGAEVPPGFAIGVSDYCAHAWRCGLTCALSPLIEEMDWSGVESAATELLASEGMDVELALSIEKAFEELGASSVAVRSSATGEDSSEHSFAGQYRTLLHVPGGEDLLEAVRLCWASLWGKRVLEYRHRRSVDHFAQGMGVVVQAMVPSEVSGVLFTVDPVAQRSDRMLVEVVPGLGESLVSGEAGGVVYRVERDTFRVLDVEGEGEGLDDPRLQRVWRTARKVEAHFGVPQDMEFGFAGDQLAVFQTRPITTLSSGLVEPLDPVPKATLPERAILPLAAEHYTSAPRPLDNLVFTRLVGGATEALRRIGGTVRPEDEEAFRKEIWRQAYRLPRHRLTWRVLMAGGQQRKLLQEDWLAWWMAGPEPSLREVSAPMELEALSDEALFARADRILAAWEGLLGKRMYVVGAFRAERYLRALVTLGVGRRASASVMADLGRSLDTPVSKSNRALWLLSRRARENPDLLAIVRDRSPSQLEGSPEGRALLLAVEDFLSSYGHREGASWYLSSPTWSRNPAQVWGLLAALAELDEAHSDPHRARAAYLTARERVERRLKPVPWLRRRFLSTLKRLRAHTVFREQSHFDLTRPLRALQEIAAQWGRRLADRGILAEEGEVFFLTPDEVKGWSLDTPPAPDIVEEIVARRKATYQAVNTRWQEERSFGSTARSGLKGAPASPGVARGLVRVVRAEHQFHLVQPGEILVCPHTNPSWTPLFAVAAGVVAEVGGPASHAAIVAREYGIPCVLAVPGATEVLRDGDEVVLDGAKGSVHRVEKGDGAGVPG